MNFITKFEARIIDPQSSLLEGFKKMDEIDRKLLIVAKNQHFVGLLSAGDIQRAIIQNISLGTAVKDILRKNIRIASPNDPFESIKQMMINFRMELCPVINNKNEIIDIYLWEDLFQDTFFQCNEKINLPVVVMAGGLGTRLMPLTSILPKPLLPIRDKTIIEHIFERFHIHGCNTFYVSINYKADLIEYYLRNQNLPYQLEFFREVKPMGTAGSLSLMKGEINSTFFVTNCDILIEQDYSDILAFHRENVNEITIVAALKNYSIPYGTIETGENGQLLTLMEKPDLTFKINSGMYVLEPNVIDEIPVDQVFHITNLIERVKCRGGKVGVFPISEGSWKDIGDWNLFLQENSIKQK
jgi:dTDP-glucose pyrophosphorylase